MKRFRRSSIAILVVFLAGGSLAELQLVVSSESEFDLTAEQKLEVMKAPGRLVTKPPERRELAKST